MTALPHGSKCPSSTRAYVNRSAPSPPSRSSLILACWPTMLGH